uniref:Family with sequence similarity 131 member C n=1 Tax=Podarcis muralis TaxID=64176 RepID=A0A670J1C8_PODMU
MHSSYKPGISNMRKAKSELPAVSSASNLTFQSTKQYYCTGHLFPWKPSCKALSGAGIDSVPLFPSVLIVPPPSLLPPPGLVQSIKDHVTKPTAMARGRVAHLIEWKGWSAPRTGWEQALTEEEIYADLTDELKEAWFAAGVAEQFAIAEATLSAWSSLDEEELNYGGDSQEGPQLQGNFQPTSGSPSNLDSSLPAFSLSSCKSPLTTGWSTPMDSLAKGLPQEAGQESPVGSLWLQRSSTSLRYVDSSSLSEDEVFYN